MKAMLPAIETFCNAATTAPDLPALFGVLEQHLSTLGFQRFGYRGVNVAGSRGDPVVFCSYPQEWQLHYIDCHYGAMDPVVIAGQTALLPFRWGLSETVTAKTEPQHRMFSEAEDFGVGHGLCVPVHCADGEFATLGLVSDTGKAEFDRICAELAPTLHLTVLYFHNTVRRLTTGETGERRVHLTPRERECLVWTAQGKTSWEVSVILGIAEGTVVYHLKNVMRKFSVHNKYHAVVKAIMQGMIQP